MRIPGRKFVIISTILLVIYVFALMVSRLLLRFASVRLPDLYDLSALKDLHYPRSLSDADKKEPLKRFGYNVVKSHSVEAGRTLPDTRPDNCVTMSHNGYMPTVSVIIVFKDIDRSTLLRTVISVLINSRPAPLLEILLVDDGSANDDDAGLLIKLPGIRILRNEYSRGRSVARNQGALFARGQVIVFMDSIVEVNRDWLTPLLVRIQQSPRSIVSPTIDRIDYNTFEYRSLKRVFRGGFDWGLQYQWEPIQEDSDRNPSAPIQSPALPGTVLAIRKDLFVRFGRFKSPLGGTGAESIELSLRAWMCGFLIEIIPCSRVGVIHIKGRELGVAQSTFNEYIKKARAIAEVWLGEYKRFFYSVRPSARLHKGLKIHLDVDSKELLKCEDFSWYLKSVYPQLQPLVNNEMAYGRITQKNNCVDLDPGQLPLVTKLRPCQLDKNSQEWSWRKRGVIVTNGMCLTSNLQDMKGYVLVQFCNDYKSQVWIRSGRQIVHKTTGYCLDAYQSNTALMIVPCDPDVQTQYWTISKEKSWGNTEMDYMDREP